MNEIAGNEVEIESGSVASQQSDMVGELLPLSSSLEPLSAAVELALAGEKVSQSTDGARNSEQCRSLSETTNQGVDSGLLAPETKGQTKGKVCRKFKCPHCDMVFRGSNKLQGEYGLQPTMYAADVSV